ncbi:MAG: uracil-DNA glycosylase [candidate division Zixibacteria bacterium]|nr:uracil-DNA glycosylase [candidate division Zixibacteria bacterium]
MELGTTEVIVERRKRTTSGTKSTTIVAESPVMAAIPPSLDMIELPEIQKRQFKSLGDHCEAINKCQLCELGATRNKFVYGVGNPQAKLMFIGEAPGAEEDRRGEPFVGRAGQLLDQILLAIKFTRQDIYIANILKCRPPNNRDPLPEEMNKCTPYLNEQIRIIEPKLICLLGRIAAQALLKTSTPLGKLRGHWHEHNGVPVLVTYHPAALLRFPAYKKETWEDVQKLRARYDELG